MFKRFIKSYHYILVLLCVQTQGIAQYSDQSILDSSYYFTFHNNYWINLHHFLYQKAGGSQLSKLQRDGNEMLIIGEKEVEESLTSQQRTVLDGAISYYKDNLIQKGLLRDLGLERFWLQKQSGYIAIADSTVSKEFVDVLNKSSKIYQKTYWSIHKKHNKDVLDFQISNIQKLEKRIIPRMEKVALTPWPFEKKVRVDLTTYANYAGAYTPTRPIFNVLVSTIDPKSRTPDFLETIFHEGSHLLFRYGGTWRESIFKTFEAGNYTMSFPRHLWHVSLFYLCGQICIEEFTNVGIKGYRMTMFSRNIFTSYHSPDLFAMLDEYITNRATLNETTKKMLRILESKSQM
ncbi:MAG: hypothetical protein AAGC43_08960 [Bacteroidota bacterium]